MLVPFSCWALADELEKIAASKWRQMLRAGALGAEDIAKLRGAQRPVGGALLDYGREAAGIDTGSRALARKWKIPMFERDPTATRAAALDALRKGKLREAARTGAKAVEGRAVQKVVTPRGGGASVLGVVGLDPKDTVLKRVAHGQAKARGVKLTPEDHAGVEAMLRRHEVREAIETKKRLFPQLKPKSIAAQTAMVSKPKRVGWNVPGVDMSAAPAGIDPKIRQVIEAQQKAQKNIMLQARAGHMMGRGVADRMAEATAKRTGAIGKRISDVARKAQAKGIPGARRAQSVGSKIQSTSEYAPGFSRKMTEASAPASASGIPIAGQHLSPAPIVEESGLLPMLPEMTQRTFRAVRGVGETPALARHGVQYGVALTPQQRRKVMSEWSRFNV